MSSVLLIVVDALRADSLGCYAGRDMGTPNLDALAEGGIRYENAISQASWTRPAVASLLTGLYPSQHGLTDRIKRKGEKFSVSALDPGIRTLAERVRESGLRTFASVGCNANLKPIFDITRGFERFEWHPTNDGAVIAGDFERWLRNGELRDALCYLHFMDVHNPLPVETIPSRLDEGLSVGASGEGMGRLVEHYAAAVRRVDEHTGRIARALEAAGMLDETWIMVTADHGEELMDHGKMLSHGRTVYRELVRVPLIMTMPGGEPGGRVVGDPAQLVDLAPTLLGQLDLPCDGLPGRSLLPATSGAGYAFSELVRRDLYAQSVTTRTHHFIQTYVFEEIPAAASLDDLRAGQFVEVKGQPVRNGSFLATSVTLKRPKAPKVLGTVEHIDGAAGAIRVMGLDLRMDENTRLIGQHKQPIGPDGLRAGDRVNATFTPGADGLPTAVTIRKTNPGRKSQLRGPIERAEILESGRTITILGKSVSVDASLPVSPLRERRAGDAEVDAPSRTLTGDFVDVRRELFDIESDPAETTNIVDERPDIAQELEEALMLWSESLVLGGPVAEASVDVDPETLEQLRRMGYVE